METVKKLLTVIGPARNTHLVDPYNHLLATPFTRSSHEAAIYRYGNCEVLHDGCKDGLRVIRVDTSKERKVFR